MKVKRQLFLYTVRSDSSLYKSNSIPTLKTRQERISIPHSGGSHVGVLCVYLQVCQCSTCVSNMCCVVCFVQFCAVMQATTSPR